MTRLERRTRLLLRAYPADYRRDHGEEITGTLLETTPAGREWPAARESRALIMGGLRARAAANGRLGTRTSLRLAALLGTALYLAFVTGVSLSGWQTAPVPLLTAAAVAAGWLEGRTTVKIALAAAAAVAWLGYSLAAGTGLIRIIDPVVALAVFAGLAVFGAPAARPRPPRAWLWMPAVVALTGPVLGGLTLALSAGQRHPSVAQRYLDQVNRGLGLAMLVVLAAAVLWLVVDVRPAIGLLVAFAWDRLALVTSVPAGSWWITLVPWLLAAAVLAASALWLQRRRAVRPRHTSA